MLFIHQDQAQPRQRCKHRQAGAEDDVGVAAEGLDEAARARTVGQARMQAHHPGRRKALGDALLELWGEGNFGHQHQHLPALGQPVRGQAQIDLGLAAAGDPMQQPAAKALSARQHGLQRAVLLGRQRGQAAGGIKALCIFGSRHQPAAAQQVTDRLAALTLAHHAAPPGRAVLRQRLQQGQRLAGAARGLQGLGARHADVEQRVFVLGADAVGTTQSGWQGERDHLAQRRVVVTRDESHQLQPVRGQRQHIALNVKHRLETAGVDAAIDIGIAGERNDQTVALATAEWHLDAAPDVLSRRIRGEVIEHLRQGKRQGDTDNGHAARGRTRKDVLSQRLVIDS